MTPANLEAALAARLDPAGASWLAAGREQVAREPAGLRRLFPAAGRRLGRGPLDPAAAPADLHAWTVDDAGRTLLLMSAPAGGAIEELPGLYRQGDAAERRGALRALSVLPDPGEAGVALVLDALRTNDPRLVAAALGPFATRRLGEPAFEQAVLKCVFVGVPLASVAGLAERSTPRLAGMLADFAHERVAAGRDVPPDVWLVLDRWPAALAASGFEAELQSPVPERREAARRALAARAARGGTTQVSTAQTEEG